MLLTKNPRRQWLKQDRSVFFSNNSLERRGPGLVERLCQPPCGLQDCPSHCHFSEGGKGRKKVWEAPLSLKKMTQNHIHYFGSSPFSLTLVSWSNPAAWKVSGFRFEYDGHMCLSKLRGGSLPKKRASAVSIVES